MYIYNVVSSAMNWKTALFRDVSFALGANGCVPKQLRVSVSTQKATNWNAAVKCFLHPPPRPVLIVTDIIKRRIQWRRVVGPQCRAEKAASEIWPHWVRKSFRVYWCSLYDLYVIYVSLTQPYLVPKSIIIELYIHFSIRLHGIVPN
jgi:hypothetical protein